MLVSLQRLSPTRHFHPPYKSFMTACAATLLQTLFGAKHTGLQRCLGMCCKAYILAGHANRDVSFWLCREKLLRLLPCLTRLARDQQASSNRFWIHSAQMGAGGTRFSWTLLRESAALSIRLATSLPLRLMEPSKWGHLPSLCSAIPTAQCYINAAA